MPQDIHKLAKALREFRRREANEATSIPRSVPKSKRRVIVHNHIQHTVDMPNGAKGFRFWTQLKSTDLIPCKCGWAGLPHYRVKGMGTGESVKGTWEELTSG